MKKLILLGIIVFLITGCTSIKKESITSIIDDSLYSNANIHNTFRKGYKYYKPRGLNLRTSDNYNEVLSSDKYLYYLYVDIVSYYNHIDFNYTKNTASYYSNSIVKNSQKGYIEINNYKNDLYLVEIMYNYAKIEVIVLENDLKEAIANSMSIITSITYNDNIIKNYLSSTEYDMREEDFDIFQIVGSDNYLEFTDDLDDNEGVKDPDYVN